MEQLGSHWTDFHEIWYLSGFFFEYFIEEIPASLNSDMNNEYFDKYIFMIISRSILFDRFVNEVKTHILCSTNLFFFYKILLFVEQC